MLKHALAFAVGLGFSASAMALEQITEEELSTVSAQDGVSILWKMDDNGVRINSMALVDKNGIDTSITTGYNNAGKLIASNLGFKTCAETSINGSCTTLLLPTIRFDIDAIGDHNGNGISSPMLNVSLTLGGGANKMRFYIDKISVANNIGGAPTTLMTFGGRAGADIDSYGHYIDIVPQGSNKTILNMQLGFERQGNLIKFTNGNFGTIDFGTVSFIDGTNTANSLRFGLKLEEFDITDLGVDIDTKGLMFRHANFGGDSAGVGKMDITMTDIKMGGASAASMGTIGLQNINIKDLVVVVAGKN
ncbi:MAG TPA: hypothetical protein PLW01_07840 [Agitococcus sp.]|nr:hypothetical protein [Agitococcus sp.]